jgi:hypothetical protein
MIMLQRTLRIFCHHFAVPVVRQMTCPTPIAQKIAFPLSMNSKGVTRPLLLNTSVPSATNANSMVIAPCACKMCCATSTTKCSLSHKRTKVGAHKPYDQTTTSTITSQSPDTGVLDKVNSDITNNRPLWISYDNNPPREINPRGFKGEGKTDSWRLFALSTTNNKMKNACPIFTKSAESKIMIGADY